MAEAVPGPHHCIGTARAVTDLVFRSLRAHCMARGGNLSLSEIDNSYNDIIKSFSSGFDLFEQKHKACMGASMALAAMPFARDKILATLLRACGEKSAEAAFALQAEMLGEPWLDDFFDSLAGYARHHLYPSPDTRLIDAYVEVAMSLKAAITVEQLLKSEVIQGVLFECVARFDTPEAAEAMTKDVCDSINREIAVTRNLGAAHVSKITEQQTFRFLTLLPNELGLTLKPLFFKEAALVPAVGE